MRVLKSVNFSYVSEQDRILAAINPGDPEAWSCWLTRRVALRLLEQASEFLVTTSHMIRQAPANVRSEMVTFEREVALAKTAKAMSVTPPAVLKASALEAELAVRVTISGQGDSFRIELHGEKGGGASGSFARAEVQRVLQMLKATTDKADWSATPAAQAAPTVEESGAKPVRH